MDKSIDEQIRELKEKAKELNIDPSHIEALLADAAQNTPSVAKMAALQKILQFVEREKTPLSKYFDESELVEAEILPLWTKIHALCEEHSIPVLFAISPKNTKEEAGMTMGHVLLKERTDERFYIARVLLSGEGRQIDMRKGSSLIDMLASFKKDFEDVSNACSCDECTARRAKEAKGGGTIDA
jgi:hypothetical protein